MKPWDWIEDQYDRAAAERVCDARNGMAEVLNRTPNLELYDALAALGILITETMGQIEASDRIEVADGWVGFLMSQVRHSLGRLDA